MHIPAKSGNAGVSSSGRGGFICISSGSRHARPTDNIIASVMIFTCTGTVAGDGQVVSSILCQGSKLLTAFYMRHQAVHLGTEVQPL